MSSQDLVLLGGGHTHALVLKMLAMKPIADVRVTLISDSLLTPYSGMLPGSVAGHYSQAETLIDLNALCRRIGCRWVHARASNIDTVNKQVIINDRPPISYDRLSVDIGCTPDSSIDGAKEFAVGVKPISGFHAAWENLLSGIEGGAAENVEKANEQHWAVIGAGAGGAELVMAMAFRLKSFSNIHFHLVFSGERVLTSHPLAVSKAVEAKMKSLGVALHSGFRVQKVQRDRLVSSTGEELFINKSIVCTGAIGAHWLQASNLKLSRKNFIQVNSFLQSLADDKVFAVGDIADMVQSPRPKAGVFAVRQAPYLLENLRRSFTGDELRKVVLQKEFLSLISLGDKSCVASRNGLSVCAAWVWAWKDRIDQRFMRQFAAMEAHSMPMPAHNTNSDQPMPCGGCGSKLGPQALSQNLKTLQQRNKSSAIELEDAALWQASPDSVQVQSIDGFRSFTRDGYYLGRIATNHALSDLYAMGAKPRHAQAWINVDYQSPRLQQRDHAQILTGVADALAEQGASLLGGHSSEGVETHVAIVANGELGLGAAWAKSTPAVGDALVLTKALGTGIILAADMVGKANADSVEAAFASMLQHNGHAAAVLKAFQPSAVTDVSGFGLLGHLLEMLQKNTVDAELQLDSIPTIKGVFELIAGGHQSSLQPQLLHYLEQCEFSVSQTDSRIALLLDPQTSGGLLISVSPDCLDELVASIPGAVVIGQITAPQQHYFAEDKRQARVVLTG